MAKAGVLRTLQASNNNFGLSLDRATLLLSILVFASITDITFGVTTLGRKSDQFTQSSPNTQGNKDSRPTVMHPAFQNAGKKGGLEIWRVENFQPVAVPASDHGKFFTGDSYIILNTKEDYKKRLSWDVHFWLGLETSQDEAGAAAILTIQLDELLGGSPVQHREVQEHESSKFLGYFRNSVRYVSGGVSSGFNHVNINDGGQKRLFHVKGKRNVRVREVGISISNMNKGDCFILEDDRNIYVYVGPNSKRVEKLKAISAANQIRDQDHNGRAQIHILDEYGSESDQESFFRILGGGSPSQVPEESTADEDAAFETKDAAAITLYKVSDSAGSLQVDTISTKPIRQEMLKSEDCFILDTGSAIYVWVGKGATQTEKTQSIARAQSFIQTKKYPSWTPVHRIIENAETAPFKQYFATWRDIGMQHTRLIRAAAAYESSDSGMDEEIDANEIQKMKKSGGRALGFMPDNGEGDVKIWRIDDHGPISVGSDKFGILFGSKTYVMKYHYRNKKNDEGVIIYYWQGLKASSKDKAKSAIYTSQLDKELNDAALQVRVIQGHEPRHFLKIFKGQLITYTDDDDNNKIHLFRIRGTCADDVRATEQKAIASSLSSNDVFIVKTPSTAYIWNGIGASIFEKEMAASVAKKIAFNVNVQTIEENVEPTGFWNALNGKGDYDRGVEHPGAPLLEPILFHCKLLSNGKIKYEEIVDFEQSDLDEDDIMILDAGDEIYLWQGKDISDEEKRRSMEVAHTYIKREHSDRSSETNVIITVRQGFEPRTFKQMFPTWRDDFWKSRPSYEEYRNQIVGKNKLK